jgi:hypothetical protein
MADAARIAGLSRGGTRILPVSVWPSSTVTRQVEEIIASGAIGRPGWCCFEQSKPRFSRTQANQAHASAFEVELPHQVLLALHLAGPMARVKDVYTWPMVLPDGVVMASHGGVRLTIEHRGGAMFTAISDLTAPVRVRRLRVIGTAIGTGEVIAHYPSGDDNVGHIRAPGASGWKVVWDAPLTQFLTAAYRHFADLAGPPPGGLPDHLEAVALLEAAVAQAVTVAGREAVPAC